MHEMNPFALSFWVPVGVSVLCGSIIGLERQLRGKPAGVRTSTLICLSTQLFVQLGAELGAGGADPTRIVGQIVTGVGFLGAGVIMAQEKGVTGVTTAAVIWILAAVGAAIGIGEYHAAIALAMTTVVILTGVELLETSLRWLRRGAHSRVKSEKRVSD